MSKTYFRTELSITSEKMAATLSTAMQMTSRFPHNHTHLLPHVPASPMALKARQARIQPQRHGMTMGFPRSHRAHLACDQLRMHVIRDPV